MRLVYQIWPLLFFLLGNNDVINFNDKDTSDVITTPPVLEDQFVKSSHSQKVKVYELSKSGETIGHSVWMSMDNTIKSKYFAFKTVNNGEYESVHEQYQRWKGNKKIILNCSGAFSTEFPGQKNNNAITVGLTVDDGKVINRTIDKTMDALVVMSLYNELKVYDLENNSLEIGQSSFDMPREKARFLDWAKQKRSTIFQTQLLSFNDKLRISRKGRKQKRERRVLAMVENKYRQSFHIIFDLTKSSFLFDTARDVFYHLKDDKGMTVKSIINLDTGAYNILELFDGAGRKNVDIIGDTDVKSSTNLIVYYSY